MWDGPSSDSPAPLKHSTCSEVWIACGIGLEWVVCIDWSPELLPYPQWSLLTSLQAHTGLL